MNQRTRVGVIGAVVGGVLGAIIGLVADTDDVGLWIAVGIAIGAALAPYVSSP